MQTLMASTLAALLLTATSCFGEGERAGDFDYYVVALSWSPNWCRLEGDRRNSPQCAADTGHGWILHGLWPQYHQGYPSYCKTAARPPSRRMTAEMADIMGTSGLAWHQWRKHGSCTGLEAAEYYELSRAAYAKINRPDILRQLQREVLLPAAVIEDAFLEANPNMEPDGITITCKSGQISEARICMSRGLEAVPCGRDVVKDCTLDKALFTPIR